ncbi:helix-turn-helix domain-containing protein [Natronomonas amylolytica]|uniref:helix-turn-helix domain-containing protein n=1 Tax=Natronomonas amylolytica TaxID=3108498 RepID=UPI00300A9463
MPQARLSISLPEDIWMHGVSTTYAETEFQVLTALMGENAGIALLSITTDDLLSITTDIERQPDVTAIDLLWKQARTGLVQVGTTSPPLLLPLWEAGIPIEMPFTIRDGTATWELTTTAERLSALGTYLERADIGYELEHTAEIGTPNADRLLTERQREVLLAALDAGYYAVPREVTLTELAERLDISKATCSDILHRAEHSVLSWFAEEHAGRT